MKLCLLVIVLALLSAASGKVKRSRRFEDAFERQLLDFNMSDHFNLEDADDSAAIKNAASRVESLVSRLAKYKLKFSREIQQSMSSMRNSNFRKRRGRSTELRDAARRMGGEAEQEERRLAEQPSLKDYGKIATELKAEMFEAIKAPLQEAAAAGEAAQQSAMSIN